MKKNIFKNEFLSKWKDFGINRVVIESPLLSSNNVNTVATLLQFNGMISECIYDTLNIIPDYITSYDARSYAFPELFSIRKFNKKGDILDKKTILNNIKKNHAVLFGSYVFDCAKKEIIWNKISEIFPDINWLYNKKNELKKENFDASDALTAIIGFLNLKKYGKLEFNTELIFSNDNIIKYNISYWNKSLEKEITLQ